MHKCQIYSVCLIKNKQFKFSRIVNNDYMNKILLVFQILLKSSLIFLLAFIWLRFFVDKSWLAALIALAVTAVLQVLSHFISKKSSAKNPLKMKEKEEAENMFFTLTDTQKPIDFFYQLACSRHSNVVKKKSYILLNHHDGTKVVLYPKIQYKNLSPDDLSEIVLSCKKDCPDKIVVPCNDIDSATFSLAKSYEIEILLLNKYDSYSLLYKEYDFYPEIKIQSKKTGTSKFKTLAAYSLNRARTKGYIAAAFVLFFASLFVKMNVYYYIFASILLLFALVSYLNPKYNNKVEAKNIL